MKRVVLAVALSAACCLAAAASLSARAASKNSPPCTPKITKIGGHQAVVNCGPATATLHLSGKTYTFRNGLCQQARGSNPPNLILELGTTVIGAAGNAGKPSIGIETQTSGGGTMGNGSVISTPYYGGKKLPVGGLIRAKGSIAKGTFASAGAPTAAFPAYTGSWNCHGFVWRKG